MVWFALIIAATIAVSMFLIVNQSKKTMSFANFKNLIETTQYEKLNSNKLVDDFEGKIIIEKTVPTKSRTEYSNPRNLVIGDRVITGLVDYRELSSDETADASNTKEPTEVMFVVNKALADTQSANLEAMLVLSLIHI